MSKRRIPEVPRLALSQQEAAEALGMSVTTFKTHVEHELPVVFAGSLVRYPVWGLDQWTRDNASRGGRRVA